jgi:hypothetical protein
MPTFAYVQNKRGQRVGKVRGKVKGHLFYYKEGGILSSILGGEEKFHQLPDPDAYETEGKRIIYRYEKIGSKYVQLTWHRQDAMPNLDDMINDIERSYETKQKMLTKPPNYQTAVSFAILFLALAIAFMAYLSVQQNASLLGQSQKPLNQTIAVMTAYLKLNYNQTHALTIWLTNHTLSSTTVANP